MISADGIYIIFKEASCGNKIRTVRYLVKNVIDIDQIRHLLNVCLNLPTRIKECLDDAIYKHNLKGFQEMYRRNGDNRLLAKLNDITKC